MNKKTISVILSISMMIGMIAAIPSKAYARAQSTGIELSIDAAGAYLNWDGVSNVAQFVSGGQYCFAYYKGKKVYVIKTKNGEVQDGQIVLEMKHPIFGGVACDSEGNYYVVTGENNETDDTGVETVFISKYDKNGKHIKTVGDNGSSSLASYYNSSFYTKYPFNAGNCDIAINGNILAVNYAREMYSGHQSNSVFMIDVDTMKKVSTPIVYQSHSFAQRVIPFGDHFVYASEGDCYDRSFTIYYGDQEVSVFDFWVREDALADWDMWTLNNNFAHMGGLTAVNDHLVALVGTSVKALNKKAASQKEQLFIQIFDPSKDLSTEEAYVTAGKRSGVAGPNGRTKVTNYGVKWLTKVGKKARIENPQVVSDGNDTIMVLYEKYVNNKYKGVHYILMNAAGEVITEETCFSATARLNPCRMPVYVDGEVYWTANEYGDKENNVLIYNFKLP